MRDILSPVFIHVFPPVNRVVAFSVSRFEKAMRVKQNDTTNRYETSINEILPPKSGDVAALVFDELWNALNQK